MVKEIIKLNNFVELHVQITPEMKKDFAECEAMAKVVGGDGKDCNTCSLCNTVTSAVSLCEISEVAKLLN